MAISGKGSVFRLALQAHRIGVRLSLHLVGQANSHNADTENCESTHLALWGPSHLNLSVAHQPRPVTQAHQASALQPSVQPL